MRKEVTIAIGFGLVVALIVTIGLLRARTALQEAPTGSGIPLAQPVADDTGATPPTGPAQSALLKVVDPPEDSVQASAQISVSGTTIPNSPIVILQDGKESLTQSDGSGNFSAPITLSVGPNFLDIRALPTGQAPMDVLRTVVFLQSTPAPSSSPTASPSASQKPKPKATPKL